MVPPKNWEERTVPLPEALVERLKRRKEQRKAVPNELVFPNRRGASQTASLRQWNRSDRKECAEDDYRHGPDAIVPR